MPRSKKIDNETENTKSQLSKSPLAKVKLFVLLIKLMVSQNTT